MRLTRVVIDGVRGISSLALSVPPGEPVVVTGPSACGKTSVLEAILAARGASLPGGLPPPATDWLSAGRRGGFVELTWDLDDEDRARGRLDAPTLATRWGLGAEQSSELSARQRDLVGATRVEYFDASRSLAAPGSGDVPKADARRGQRTTGKYAWVERYLVERARDEAHAVVERIHRSGLALATRDLGALESFAKKLQALCPRLRWAGVDRHEGRERATFTRPNGDVRALAHLGASEQMLVLFAATWDALNLEGALVLVDLPELGLHPADHAAAVEGLGRLAAGSLVLASTSPAVLRGAASDRVVSIEPPSR